MCVQTAARCKHLPTMAPCSPLARRVELSWSSSPRIVLVRRIQRVGCGPGACVDAHAAQSEQSRQLAQLSALPACARNAVDLGPFLLAIVDWQARVKCSCSSLRTPVMRRASSTPPLYSLLIETHVFSFFKHGFFDFFADCGVACAPRRGSTGGVGDRPGQHDNVPMARSQRHVYWILGAVASKEIGTD